MDVALSCSQSADLLAIPSIEYSCVNENSQAGVYTNDDNGMTSGKDPI